jgi:hypothetical protein
MSRTFVALRAAAVVGLALGAFLSARPPVHANPGGNSYYVSTKGSDQNSGSLNSPWRTIQHAANSVGPGATVYVYAGVYNEAVTFPTSGTVSAPITFESLPGQVATLDGTGLKCCGSSGTQGLITIAGTRNYITVRGFELRNFTTSSSKATPSGVWVTGSGTGVKILNNIVHGITTKSEKNGNAFGIAVYGTTQSPITQITLSGNEVYDLKTGESESLNVTGNVTYFKITNNLVHDNDNIGIDAIGYEKTAPVGYDEAMYGEISGNTVYNISGVKNPGEGDSYDADGLYCDGCAYVTFENNFVMNSDYGIEVTSENQICLPNGTEWSGPNDTGNPGMGKSPCYGRYVTVRNNVFTRSANVGMSIGGAKMASAKGGEETTGGSTFATVFANNTLFNNVTQPKGTRASSPGGEFQIQHQIGSAQGNYFENNLAYAGAYNHWLYGYVKSSAQYPAPPLTSNWNLYYSQAGYVAKQSIYWEDVDTYPSFANFVSTTGEDALSLGGVDPQVEGVNATPVDLDIAGSSRAANGGSTSLPCSVGWCDPGGTSPNSLFGATDYLGYPRTNGSNIAIGAYQVTGIASNATGATLSAGTYHLASGGSTTLAVTVATVPGGAGVPSGTVNFMLASTVLATEPLLPIGATASAASLPLSASQLAQGSNTLTAVYSGNSIALGCCSAASPPGGGTQVPIYPAVTSPAITITCGNERLRASEFGAPAGRPNARAGRGSGRYAPATPC